MLDRRAFCAWCLCFAWPLAPACYRSAASELPAGAAADWNAAGVAWTSYAEGMARGKATRTPIVLIFYTDWCPHCHNYSHLFHDPELVQLSRRFVMIRVERDGNRELSEQYAIDGEYIPRTFFLTPGGAVLTDLTGDNEDFRYFLDEHDPTELISLMEQALQRLGGAQPGGG